MSESWKFYAKVDKDILLPSLTFFSHSWWWSTISGSLLIQFLPVNCSFSESSISLQCSCKVSFEDRCWNKWKNGEHNMVISLRIWKNKLFLIVPPPANISLSKVIQFFVETSLSWWESRIVENVYHGAKLYFGPSYST